MNFSFFLRSSCRMRSNAWDTLSQSCARCLPRRTPALPSTRLRSWLPPSFVRRLHIIGYSSSPDAGQDASTRLVQTWDLPLPVHELPTCRVLDHPGPLGHSR